MFLRIFGHLFFDHTFNGFFFTMNDTGQNTLSLIIEGYEKKKDNLLILKAHSEHDIENKWFVHLKFHNILELCLCT